MSEMMRLRQGSFGRVAVLDLKSNLVKHAHSDSHLKFWLHGDRRELEVVDQFVPFNDKCAVAVNSWEPHCSPLFNKGESAVFLLLYLKPSWLVELCSRNGMAPWFRANSFAVTEQLRRLVDALVSSLLGDQSDIEARIEIGVARLVKQSMHTISQTSDTGLQSTAQTDIDDRVKQSIEYMQNNLHKRPRFGEVARIAGVSRPHFFSLFRQAMKVTPNVYWNTVRVESAIERVVSSDISLHDLAYDLGFSEPANFSRFFKNQTGISPGRYREVANV